MEKSLRWAVLLGLVLGGALGCPFRGDAVAVRTEMPVLLVSLLVEPPEIVGMVKMQHRRFPWEKDATVFRDRAGEKLDAETFRRQYDRQMVVLVLDPLGVVAEVFPQ